MRIRNRINDSWTAMIVWREREREYRILKYRIRNSRKYNGLENENEQFQGMQYIKNNNE